MGKRATASAATAAAPVRREAEPTCGNQRTTVADNPPTEIQTLIDNHINAFTPRTSSFSSASLATTRSSSTASRLIAG